MKVIIFGIINIIIALLFFSCAGKGSEHLAPGFGSWKNVVEEFASLAAKKKLGSPGNLLLTRKEFANAVYIYLPEAMQKNPMPVADYWTMSTYKRTRAIEYFINDFKEAKNVKLVKTGIPKKVKIFGPVTVYNKVPVSFSNDRGSVKKYEDLFSAIVCVKTGLFTSSCKLWSADVED